MESLTREQLAETFGVAVETVRKWDASGRGPKSFKLPGTRRVLYAREDVEAFVAAARAGGSDAA